MNPLTRFFPFALVIALVSGWAVSLESQPQKPQTNPAYNDSKVPRMVLLIRHAEKPPKAEHSPDLTVIGRERAQRIPKLFLPAGSAMLPSPDFLFATHVSRSSNRPVETLTPLAQALHLELNDQYSEDEAEKLAAELLSGKYAGKVVIVCWHHGTLPALSFALGVPNPPVWSDAVFDRVWKVEWVDHTGIMTNLPQNLLPGDSQ
jgi:hypothetical protein